MEQNKCNVTVRKLISNGTNIRLDFVFKQGQNDGLTPPSNTDWASYRLESATSDTYSWKDNKKIKLNYELNYIVTIYTNDTINVFRHLNSYLHRYEATIILHQNNMHLKKVQLLNHFDELINNKYYSRLDVNITFVTQFTDNNESNIDFNTIKINYNYGG